MEVGSGFLLTSTYRPADGEAWCKDLPPRPLSRSVQAVLMNLQGRKELNGSKVLVREYIPAAARWAVKCGDDWIKVRPANVWVKDSAVRDMMEEHQRVAELPRGMTLAPILNPEDAAAVQQFEEMVTNFVERVTGWTAASALEPILLTVELFCDITRRSDRVGIMVCQSACDRGILEHAAALMRAFPHHGTLCGRAMDLFCNVCYQGEHDTLAVARKTRAVRAGIVPLIVSAIHRHHASEESDTYGNPVGKRVMASSAWLLRNIMGGLTGSSSDTPELALWREQLHEAGGPACLVTALTHWASDGAVMEPWLGGTLNNICGIGTQDAHKGVPRLIAYVRAGAIQLVAKVLVQCKVSYGEPLYLAGVEAVGYLLSNTPAAARAAKDSGALVPVDAATIGGQAGVYELSHTTATSRLFLVDIHVCVVDYRRLMHALLPLLKADLPQPSDAAARSECVQIPVTPVCFLGEVGVRDAVGPDSSLLTGMQTILA